MPAYYYSSTAGVYTLTGDVAATATIIVVNSATGLPTAPFKVVLEPGQPTEEIVKVTSLAGTSLTVVRGWNGTAAVAHAAGAAVRHMMTAEDLTLSRAHEDATPAHGATGAVMGTTNTQVVTNKNLTDASNTFPNTLATLTGAQALTNKNLTDATNTFPTTLARSAGQAFTGNVTAPNLPASSGAVAGKRMHWGITTATTGAGGVINLTHALGWTPTGMIVTSNTSGSVVCTSAQATSTTNVQFTFYFVSTGAAVAAGSSLTFSFLFLE